MRQAVKAAFDIVIGGGLLYMSYAAGRLATSEANAHNSGMEYWFILAAVFTGAGGIAFAARVLAAALNEGTKTT